MKHVLLFLLITVACGTQGQPTRNEKTGALAATTTGTNYVFKLIPLADRGFGYDIYVNNKLFIHQTTIPAIPGNKGFATKADAEKAAKVVIAKMQNGETWPGITRDDWKQLNIMPKP